MARTTAAAAPRSQTPKLPSAAKNAYLLAYNALSAALWAGVLYKTVAIGSHEISLAKKDGWVLSGEGIVGAVQKGLGSGEVYGNLEGYTRVVQSLAGAEVLHSLVGTYTIFHGYRRREFKRLDGGSFVDAKLHQSMRLPSFA